MKSDLSKFWYQTFGVVKSGNLQSNTCQIIWYKKFDKKIEQKFEKKNTVIVAFQNHQSDIVPRIGGIGLNH